MKRRWSLRRRIVGAYVLLALFLGTCFSAIALEALEIIEDKFMYQRLQDAADKLIEDHLKGREHAIPGYPVVLEGAQLAPVFRNLAPGVHEVRVGGRDVHVLIRDREGHRFAVLDDQSQFELIENHVSIALALAFLLCLTLAALSGLSTASRVIAPVTRLANAVERESLRADSPLLAADDEVGLLARAFFEHEQRLKLFLEREQLFTGDVSHELRTPLMVMLGAAEVLEARLASQPELLEIAERIRRTAAETSARVAALLLLARAPDQMDAPLTDVAQIVQAEAERCRPLLSGKPVTLAVSGEHAGVLVRARPELVATAVGNLIRNACQFTERGDVRVQVHPSALVVEDTGPGLPREIATRIFERHEHGPVGSIQGTGLGLAIVRRVAEHLGWTVELLSSAEGGSRFVLHLPVANA
ncbi:HAMP domain-containing sensor histidine kinase [Ramlibacter monticola]|uniref:histidine kinase n=1 Tax=Ramlibacter monticola TaxID=1926872 RepID=A0A937CTS1_9BURK|nr:HAMP domain-containing sensor histidine kinase [Ramlibacter monticola]MBL0392910.1 HAMP domain-containing histidine kinase [Ramlibacter monticola]